MSGEDITEKMARLLPGSGITDKEVRLQPGKCVTKEEEERDGSSERRRALRLLPPMTKGITKKEEVRSLPDNHPSEILCLLFLVLQFQLTISLERKERSREKYEKKAA